MRLPLSFILSLLLCPAVGLSQAGPGAKADRAAVDEPVREFRLRNVMKNEESYVTLSEFRDKKAVVLIFTSTTCSACEDYENRIRRLSKDFAGQDVAILGIRSSAEDDGPGMRKYAETQGFAFPHLDDPRNLVADYFNVQATPTFYVIDKKGVLRYRGGYDDAFIEKRATKTYVHDALRAILEGKEVAVKTTRAAGCHLPRVEPGK